MPSSPSQASQTIAGKPSHQPFGFDAWPSSYGVAALRVEKLHVRRGQALIIRDLSFAIDAGHAVHIAGENGAGKTTLLRAMAGLLPADFLHMQFGADALLPEDMHLVGHREGLKSRLTVRENLKAVSQIMGGASHTPQLILQALQIMGLASHQDRLVSDLSAGQRRRAALARLIIVPRPIWLLDEPLTALDRAARDLLDHMVSAHLGRGGIVVATSHEPLRFAERQLTLAHAQPGEGLA